jgi:putative ABC transport system permease protein
MTIWESMQLALEAIVTNRLRSALTMLGIIFGVGAVIAAVSMTEGAKEATMARFEAMGTSTLRIHPGQMRRGPVAGGMGSVVTLTLDDADAILKQCPSVAAVAPEVSSQAQVKAGNANTNTSITGSTEAYQQVSNLRMAEGDFLTADDVKRRRKVAVLGSTVVKNLYGEGAMVAGEQIKIRGVTFEVLGRYASKGTAGAGPFDPDDRIVVPISTAIYRLTGGTEASTRSRETISGISTLSASMAASERAQKEIEALLRERHDIKGDAESDFHIMAAADLVQGAEEANRILTLLFSSIAAVSLLVGGIGIMNIMLVSVTERTREIGLRKSIGATPRDILLQFLVESLTLSLVGGIVGVATGIGVSYAMRFVGLNTAVSIPWVIIAFCFAGFVGIFFGLLPSQKAAGLNPVEALRYE